MNSRSTWMVLAATLLFAGTGCNDTDEGSAEASQPQTLAPDEIHAFCMEWERIECEANQRCCKEERYRYVDMEACLEQAERDCDVLQRFEAIETGKLLLDAAATSSELERLRSLAESCVELEYEPGELSPVLIRTVDLNESCGGERDETPAEGCTAGLFCQVTDSTRGGGYAGTCQPLRARGETCQQHPDWRSTNPSEDGLVCLVSTGTCEPARQMGETCSDFAECAGDAYCEDVCQPWESTKRAPYCDGTRPNACRASGGASQPENACSSRFTCGEDVFGASCTKGEGGWTCVCERNSVTLQSFTSPDFCTLDDDRRARALETGCGFELVY